MARMVRDVWAVPATGAGVEREFSKSGKVATWQRARLDHSTITETMLYKDMLRRYARAASKPKDPTPEEEHIESGLGAEETIMIKKMVRDSMRTF
jgi:hypothetical protein